MCGLSLTALFHSRSGILPMFVLMTRTPCDAGEFETTGDIARLTKAEHDHIVTTEASAPLIDMIGSAEKDQVVLKGGHVSLIAGPNAVKRMWPKLDAWLGEKSV